ncbi:MAG TPA: DedA family protein [Treponemataceae bacterium]|nr:DedA family protein [Treponemataceae bacterium]
MIVEIFKSVADWYMAHINYGTVTALMAIESSFIPFPSEIVVPPAAFKAASGDLNLILVVVFATAGAIIGALFNYFVALWLGRPIVYRLADTKLAHLLLIDREGVEKSEEFFRKFGRSSTFIGRFVPAIRQLISLPAGLVRMNMRDFLIFTALGSALWNAILATLGYFLYSQKALLDKYYREISLAFLALGALFILYVLLKVFVFDKAKRKDKSAA